MNRTEDRLRAALRMTANQIGADSVPPMAVPATADRARRDRQPHGTRGWLAATAAATAVAALITVSSTLAGGPKRFLPVSPLAAMPPYYVAIQALPGCSLCINGAKIIYQSDPDQAVIRSTVSGKTLAVVPVPEPYGTFTAVTAAADDRTFVLTAQDVENIGTYSQTAFYLLRLDPRAAVGHRATIRALPVPPLAAGQVVRGVSLSPDGRRLAVVYQHLPGGGLAHLRLNDLATGKQRNWALPAATRSANVPPPWGADNRTLAFNLAKPDVDLQEPDRIQLALLDTSLSGSSFGTDAKLTPLTDPLTGYRIREALPAPDGQHVLEVLIDPTRSAGSGIARATTIDVLDRATGAVTPLLQNVGLLAVLWTSPSGQAVAVSIAGQYSTTYALVTSRQLIPLSLPSGTLSAAW